MAKYGEGSASALEVGGSKNQVFSQKNSQIITLVSTVFFIDKSAHSPSQATFVTLRFCESKSHEMI